MSSSTDTSPTMLERLQQPQFDEAAWGDFVRRYGRMLLGWSRRWGASDSDAHDLTQEVLLNFVRQLRGFRYDPARSFRAWLRTVAQRTWNRLRAEQSRSPAPGGSHFDSLFDSLAARDDLLKRIEAEADRELLGLAIQRVKSRVQPQTWEAFELLTSGGKSGEEASRQLGMSLSSVYVARHNVQKMLREELQAMLGE